jgi:hypothetical protein
MNKLFEDLARAVGKALANKWLSNLRQPQMAAESEKAPELSPASRAADNRSKNSEETR